MHQINTFAGDPAQIAQMLAFASQQLLNPVLPSKSSDVQATLQEKMAFWKNHNAH